MIDVIIVALAVAVVVAVITVSIINRKKGKSSCCDCSGCALRGKCKGHNQNEQK